MRQFGRIRGPMANTPDGKNDGRRSPCGAYWVLGATIAIAAACMSATLPVATAAGPVHTAELILGGSASQGVGLGDSVALSANGKVAVLGAWRRRIGGKVDPSAEVYTLKSGHWTGPVDLALGSNVPTRSNVPSVAVNAAGTTVLVGDCLAQSAGAGFVFNFSKGAWHRTAVLTLGRKAGRNDYLGYSVALSGDGRTALLGAPYRTVSGSLLAGAGEVFTLSAGKWHGPTQLDLGSMAHGDWLGRSVALSANGAVALVGAPQETRRGGLLVQGR